MRNLAAADYSAACVSSAIRATESWIARIHRRLQKLFPEWDAGQSSLAITILPVPQGNSPSPVSQPQILAANRHQRLCFLSLRAVRKYVSHEAVGRLLKTVTPAKAGVQKNPENLDSGFRRNDARRSSLFHIEGLE